MEWQEKDKKERRMNRPLPLKGTTTLPFWLDSEVRVRSQNVSRVCLVFQLGKEEVI